MTFEISVGEVLKEICKSIGLDYGTVLNDGLTLESKFEVLSFKLPFKTKHFNKNQTVFVSYMSGCSSAKCYGRFRGKCRYVHAWVGWENKEPPQFKRVGVPVSFLKRINTDFYFGHMQVNPIIER